MEVGRDILLRWCALAEQRLEYLTELFETGRWRRYHSELAFLENIREAKAALETWRYLSLREASRDNRAIDWSWLGRTRVALPREEYRPDRVRLSQTVEISAEQAFENSPLLRSDVLGAEAEPSIPITEDNARCLTPDVVAIAERYPLLHNAL